MSREYIARDPRTGRPLTKGRSKDETDIRLLLPPEGAWRVVPESEIISLAAVSYTHLTLPTILLV